MKNKGLTARGVETAKPGKHCDGRGLYLAVTEARARKWTFRFMLAGKPHEMGLGAYPDTRLAEAREKASEARKIVKAGGSPIEARREAERPAASKPTFGQCADAYLAAHDASWRNAKHRAQWAMTLREYAATLRDMPIDEIRTEHVLACLSPLWLDKPETASRLRGRIESVLDAARVQGHRTGENPARWKGHLDHLLSRRQKLTRGHHAAMPYAEVPPFVASLREREAIAALALEFCILTAARSGEVLGAQWSEIDLVARIWTVPAIRMKASREHRVALSARALAIVERLAEAKMGDFVFPGQRSGRPLSGMAMEMLLRRMGVETTIHGFRSSFRDWCGEETHFPREVAEAALAHSIGNEVEAAYRRGDALAKRRGVMQAWCDFLDGERAENVVKLRR